MRGGRPRSVVAILRGNTIQRFMATAVIHMFLCAKLPPNPLTSGCSKRHESYPSSHLVWIPTRGIRLDFVSPMAWGISKTANSLKPGRRVQSEMGNVAALQLGTSALPSGPALIWISCSIPKRRECCPRDPWTSNLISVLSNWRLGLEVKSFTPFTYVGWLTTSGRRYCQENSDCFEGVGAISGRHQLTPNSHALWDRRSRALECPRNQDHP